MLSLKLDVLFTLWKIRQHCKGNLMCAFLGDFYFPPLPVLSYISVTSMCQATLLFRSESRFVGLMVWHWARHPILWILTLPHQNRVNSSLIKFVDEARQGTQSSWHKARHTFSAHYAHISNFVLGKQEIHVLSSFNFRCVLLQIYIPECNLHSTQVYRSPNPLDQLQNVLQ